MGGKFQDHGKLDQDLEERLSTRRIQPDRSFFSEEDKQESIHIEGSNAEVEIIINQDW